MVGRLAEDSNDWIAAAASAVQPVAASAAPVAAAAAPVVASAALVAASAVLAADAFVDFANHSDWNSSSLQHQKPPRRLPLSSQQSLSPRGHEQEVLAAAPSRPWLVQHNKRL